MEPIRNRDEMNGLMREGLIRTFNIVKYDSLLRTNLSSVGYDVNIRVRDKFFYEVVIFNPSWFMESESIFKLFFTYNNNMGYLPVVYSTSRGGRVHFFKFTKDKKDRIDLESFKGTVSKATEVTVSFEANYDDGLYKNDLPVPEISYHASPSVNRDKILRDGLVPKSGHRKSYHTDRIYLFYDRSDFESLVRVMMGNDSFNLRKPRTYDLYEVHLSKDNIIHTDPNFTQGFYTYDNIHPNDVNLITGDFG